MKHKDQILKLRSEGKSYRQIQSILSCSKGTISFHLGQGQKERSSLRGKINKKNEHPYLKKLTHFFDDRPKSKNRIPNSSAKRKIRFKIEKFFRVKNMPKYNPPTFSVKEIIEKFGEKPICYLTGRSIDIYDTKSYHFDHIVPVSRGGENTLDNLGVCIRQANLAKHDMLPEELINLCKEIIAYQEKKAVLTGNDPVLQQ